MKADSLHVFDIGRAERRYTAVAEFVDRRLPANAVIVTLTQAGSIRFYGHRPTVRWDLVDPRRFDETLESLRSNGQTPYVLLEDWEEAPFRLRFAAGSRVGRLDWPPAIQYYGLCDVRVYAIADRARFLNGEGVLAQIVPIDSM